MDSLKVFVGGLAQHTTRDTLTAYFSQFGAVDSYVMMDKGTGRSRGFGFVNFSDEAMVQAVLGMQHEVDGVPISASPYQSQSSGGGKGGGPPALAGGKPTAARDQLKVFVGGLAQHSTKASLDAYFSQFGFSDAFIMMDKASGRSRGFGFVNFKDEAVMNAVLATTHEVDGVQITVDAYRDKMFGGGGPPPRGGGGMGGGMGMGSASSGGGLGGGLGGFGGGLGGGLGSVAAAPLGGVGDALTNLITVLANPTIAQLLTGGALAGLLNLNKTPLALPAPAPAQLSLGFGGGGGGGGGLGGAFAPRGPNVASAKIFVGGLAQHTTKESLNTYFSQFGAADSIVMMDKATGRSRGFGFVDFQDESTMNQVLQYSHQIDGVIVTCSAYAGNSSRGGGPGLARAASSSPRDFGSLGPSGGLGGEAGATADLTAATSDLLGSIAKFTKDLNLTGSAAGNRFTPY